MHLVLLTGGKEARMQHKRVLSRPCFKADAEGHKELESCVKLISFIEKVHDRLLIFSDKIQCITR